MNFIRKISNPQFDLCSDGTYPVFFTIQYANFLKQFGQKLILAVCKDTGIVMPIKLNKHKFFRTVNCLYQPLRNGKTLSLEEEKIFLEKFVATARRKRLCHRIAAPSNTVVFQCAPEGTVFAPFGTYKRRLSPLKGEEIINSFQARYRTAIRQAPKIGIVIKYGPTLIDDFYQLHVETMKRSNMRLANKDYFRNYFTSLPENCLLSVAYAENEPIGAVLLTYSKHSAQYLYGGSSDHSFASGAIKYVHYDAMIKLGKLGVKEYDFVGARLTTLINSKLQGIQDFKSRFGTQLVKGIIWKVDINQLFCKVFDLLLKVKLKLQKVPRPRDIIDQEREIINQMQAKVDFSTTLKSKSGIIATIQRKLKSASDKRMLVLQLQEVGINHGDTILVHSSLRKLGNVSGGAHTIIETLQEAVGKKGNIAMPAFSYINSMVETAITEDYVFDAGTSPSVVGKITEIFRQQFGVVRSLHPTHSICVKGPLAEKITKDHFFAPTNFGPGTPFGLLRTVGAKLVGLGIGIGPVTYYHTLEDFFPDEFPDVYLQMTFPVKVRINGEIVTKTISVHDPKNHRVRIDKSAAIEKWFDQYLTQKGILHKGVIGSGNVWWMDINELFDELVSLRKKGISIYEVPGINEKERSTTNI